MSIRSIGAVAPLTFVALTLPGLACAQSKPEITLEGSYRSFAGGPEGGYGSAVLKCKPLGDTWYYLSGVSSPNGSSAIGAQTVFFGGRELEFGFRSFDQTSKLTYGLGVSFPTTFTQSSPSLAYYLGYDVVGCGTLAIIGYSATAETAIQASKTISLSDQLSANLIATVPVSGFTTVSTNSANSVRMFIGTAELKYRLAPGQSLRFGITNALGETTRTSLSSPVGNHYGGLIGLEVKF